MKQISVYDSFPKKHAGEPRIVDLGRIENVTFNDNRQGRMGGLKTFTPEADNQTPQY